ncbi:NHS-like protein 1 isoform X2 [Sinocyclocheilus anshuiensis]|uniref:NHS-like protein 1 isoform X2 n=1 Tax=Sinocyclocheilus anshuiensis TaxID=1608454 RepID=UPI0007BAA261|nr:PREDICTED: NHS-like protein 1 isoform X2 [Sinocyclocheilus anshuiensis]
MIAYVDCLSTEPAGKCWNRTYYEDEDELLPLYTRKLHLQPKTEGSLRRRLLTSKIHQQQDALWAPKPWAGPPARKGVPLQGHPNYTFSPSCQDWKAVSSLDEESKWSVHYTAPWHQQENVFLPGSRPACVDDLHHQAKVNLKTVLRECDKLRKDGFRSSQYYSQSPAFSATSLCENVHLDEKTEKKKKRFKVLDRLSQSCLSLCCHLRSWKRKASESPNEEEKLVYSMPPQTPLLEHDMDIQRSWTSCLPLPTPEEKMKLQAQSVATDIIPINITGENFDRQASFRRSAANTDTIIRRPKRVQRRKTITGVPDNIQTELANKEQDDRIHSMCMADQYSTLSRAGSVNSTLRRLDTRDSSCQTEEVKIVPPSVRRIRAQRGHGIAAQMASISSSSSISTMSECNGISYTQLNDSDQSFHSLPRQGSHISHQHCEPKYTSSPYRINSGSTSSLSYQFDMQHGSSSSLHMRSDSRSSTLNSPKLAENPNYQGSDQNNSPSLFSLSGALQNSILYGHKRTEDNQMQSPHSLAQLLSTADASLSAVSSCYESTTSLCTGIHTETESQCSTLDGRNCGSRNCVRRDSNFSESSNQSCSTLTTDQWTYEVSPKDNVTSSCSSPVSHIYNSEEHSPSKTDSSSLFSVDNEGYYTSMRMDSGLKSHCHDSISKAGDARHSLYECKDHHSQGDRASLHSNRSLTRSISLRKAKKPPLPPARTDSLRRKPQRKTHHNGSVLSEQLISSLQQSLELNLKTCSEQAPCSGFEDPWVLRPRSQSTISAASSGMSAAAAVCPVTPTHSDSSSQRSDYAESWDFYMDYQGPRSDQGLSSQFTRSASTEENQVIMGNAPYNIRFPSSHCNSSGIQSKLASSPDKVHRLTSPSSGYSSQSNTPTAGTPVTSLIRAKSPAGRLKPKVPERKSSLRSSVSSSSTSLSSNTSDSIRNIPLPPPLPDMTITSCESPSPASCSPTAAMVDSTPPLPFLPDLSSDLEERHNSLSDSSTTSEKCDTIDFPPPPPEVSESLSSNEGTNGPPPPSLLPPKPSLCILSPPPPPPPPPPPLLEMSLQTAAILNTESCLTFKKAVEIEKALNINHTGEQEKTQRPIITAQALQMVQLRPVKLKQIEDIFTAVSFDDFDDQAHNHSETNSGTSLESETTEQTWTAICVSQSENGMATSEHQYLVNRFLQASTGSLPPGTDEHVSNTGQNVLVQLSETSPVLSSHELLQCTNSSASSQSSQLKQKPPISPKKPSLSLIIPPIMHLPVSHGLKLQQVHEAQEILESGQLNGTSSTNAVNLQAIPLDLEVEEESDSDSSTPVVKSRLSLSSELSSSSLQDLQLSDLILHEHDLGLNDKDFGLCDDKSTSDDGSSSSSGSINFKEDEHEENGAVFDSSTESASSINANGEAVGPMVTPVRLRTTEDLFAAIHRSKRKVLGRGDSEEECCRNFLPSPPVTPTGSCPSLTSLPRQTGSIQRNLRRSSTSNDSFKALLLKKGSRSESGFRMSATEILKCTDPRFQRANSEHAQSDGLCTSPTSSRRAHEEWARTEGALPRLTAGLTTLKYGRSRTPPSAASSRYNSRSRIPSGPMTAICEKEGEMAESTDCCVSTESHFALPISSSSTVCAQGSN